MEMRFWITTLLLFFSVLIPPSVYAAKSISILQTSKTSLSGDEEMMVTASASGFATGEKIYIKGAFYNDGSSNYFGYTKNGSDWIKNSVSTINQRQVAIEDWDGTLMVKSDYSDSGFSDTGSYQFKIGFYTISGSGNPSSVNWSNNLAISLVKPTPIPTPTSVPTNTPTSQPTSTPTNTPAPPTATRAILPTRRPVLLPTDEPTPIENVLGAEANSTPTPNISPTQAASSSGGSKLSSKNAVVALSFIGAGCALLSLVTLIPAIRKQMKKKQEEGLHV